MLQRWLASAHRYGLIDQQDLLYEQVVDTCLSLTKVSGVHVVTHRDLHDGRLLWDEIDLSLPDLDTVAMAEVAPDLGNLWAHMDLMAVHGRTSSRARARIYGLFDNLACTLPLTEQRLEAHYHSSVLWPVFVYTFQPAAHQWLPIWVRHCLADIPLLVLLDLINDQNDS